MKSIWFKAEFISAIQRGEKRNTIRKSSKRLPCVGETFSMCCGPRTPFAFGRITESVSLDALPRDVRDHYLSKYGYAHDAQLTRITFDLVEI
jgi:hypothetical protein